MYIFCLRFSLDLDFFKCIYFVSISLQISGLNVCFVQCPLQISGWNAVFPECVFFSEVHSRSLVWMSILSQLPSKSPIQMLVFSHFFSFSLDISCFQSLFCPLYVSAWKAAYCPADSYFHNHLFWFVHTVLTEVFEMSKPSPSYVQRMLTRELKLKKDFWLSSSFTLRISTAD